MTTSEWHDMEIFHLSSFKEELKKKGKKTIVGGPKPNYSSRRVKCLNYSKCKNHTFISYESITFMDLGADVICHACFFAMRRKHKNLKLNLLKETIEHAAERMQRKNGKAS